MGLGQEGQKRKKRNNVEFEKKNLFQYYTSWIHCAVMELYQNKSKKIRWDIGKVTDAAFEAGMQYAS